MAKIVTLSEWLINFFRQAHPLSHRFQREMWIDQLTGISYHWKVKKRISNNHLSTLVLEDLIGRVLYRTLQSKVLGSQCDKWTKVKVLRREFSQSWQKRLPKNIFGTLIFKGVLNRENDDEPVSIFPVNNKLAESTIATSSSMCGIWIKEMIEELKIIVCKS